MTLQLSLVPILYLLGAGQGAFLSLMLFASKAGCHAANAYLGTLTLLFVITLFDYFCDDTGLTAQYVQIQTVLWPKEFFFGPLIYFYTRELTRPGQIPLRGRQWLHFVPGFIHVALSWAMLLLPPARQLAVFGAVPDQPAPDWVFSFLLNDLEVPLTMAQTVVYLLLSMRLVARHRAALGDNFSYTEEINLTWLRNLLIGMFVIYVCWFFSHLLFAGYETLGSLLGVSMVLLIYAMGYMGLRQPEIFRRVSSPAEDAQTPAAEPAPAAPAPDTNVGVDEPAGEGAETPAGKYQSSSLSSDVSELLLADVQSRMQQDKPFLDNKLSLPQLAGLIGISANHLSQCINEHLNQNFFDFVNGYRIEEAKARLLDASRQRDNILTVAMDSGFNSKSAFYSAFKKQTGMTPSQFRQQQGAGPAEAAGG